MRWLEVCLITLHQNLKGKDAVKQKLLSSSTYRPHFEHDDDLLDSFSDVLSNVEELKRKYLSLDFLETVEVHKQLEEKARRGGSSAKKGAKMFESHSEAVELATKSISGFIKYLKESEFRGNKFKTE